MLKDKKLLYRLFTSPARVLPDFIIAGAQKAGTTSLYRWLGKHSQVRLACKPEVHYFDLNYDRSELWYRAHFHRGIFKCWNKLWGENWIAGEKSPYYMFHPLVPERIKKLLPEVKLIFLLRDPAERAFSHYKHNVSKNREPLKFKEALKAESDRLEGKEIKIK